MRFEVMTPENTVRVTMNNPETGHVSSVLTGKDMTLIAYAITCYARSQGLAPHQVETSILWPEETIQTPSTRIAA